MVQIEAETEAQARDPRQPVATEWERGQQWLQSLGSDRPAEAMETHHRP